ncbi:MAG TPA: hypothetical protein VNQ90_03630 [Chthoniobacteraceae bacterium]|nr:hypothetical protein [Chthoniobacteraceae bacterium]
MDHDEEEEELTRGRDHLFLWTVGILLLIGLAFATWLGSFYIFGHPEKPESYRILQKLKKLDPPKRYELTKAPPGEFLSAQKAYERYGSLSAYELKRLNELLVRDYIRNYESTKRLVPYVTGRYSIMTSRELAEGDFFHPGVVALAQSVDVPQLVLEHVYPASSRLVPVLKEMLAIGLDLKLERMTDLAAVINVARTPDGRIQLTVVPLLYGSYALKQGSGSFTLDPPELLNPGGGLPIVRDQPFMEAAQAYALHMQEVRMGGAIAPGGTPAIPVAQPVAETTIVRVETPAETPQPAAEATPATASTGPDASPTPEAPGVLAETQPPVLVDEGEAEPEPTPPRAVPAASPAIAVGAPTPAASPEAAPTPARVAVANVPESARPLLQPFLAASPTPGARPQSREGGNWRTYPAGQMPRGRLLTLSDVVDLADRGVSERSYLRGDFVVTATGEHRAVLRSSSRIGSMLGSVTGAPTVRVIVEFPEGASPPSERSQVSREGDRPFEIREIRRGNDGHINVFVREVTR